MGKYELDTVDDYAWYEATRASGQLPDDWREWASDDPKNHPPGCGCLVADSPFGAVCQLALDMHNWRNG